MAKNRSREEEPSIAPKPDRWYNLSLGPSFRDHHPSSKFCTLRYDFKPASVDKSRAGSLHKTKDNKVTVEFQNNQHGKPKAIFEGVTEDYKDNDAVLFFDGESFRLEQLHRAVKRLRYVRDLSEVAAASSGVPLSSYVGATSESYPPSVGKAANDQFSDKESPKIEVENVDVESDDPQSGMNELYGVKTEEENLMDSPPAEGNTSTEIPDATNYESDEKLDTIDDHVGDEVAKEEEEEEENHYGGEVHRGIEIDINIPHQEDEEDFEIADVDVSDGEVNNTGFNAAEALRAQVAGEREKGSSSSCSSSSRSSSSSSSSSSGSESSSDSGSASSGSSASGSSHDESVTSV